MQLIYSKYSPDGQMYLYSKTNSTLYFTVGTLTLDVSTYSTDYSTIIHAKVS